MQQFKVGDWVRHVSTNHITQITTLTSETINGYPLACYIPWQPKVGEWVVPYDELYKDSFMVAQYNEEEHHLNCEPFIGQLPSFLQEQP